VTVPPAFAVRLLRFAWSLADPSAAIVAAESVVEIHGSLALTVSGSQLLVAGVLFASPE
jgi:hypothetical protein